MAVVEAVAKNTPYLKERKVMWVCFAYLALGLLPALSAEAECHAIVGDCASVYSVSSWFRNVLKVQPAATRILIVAPMLKTYGALAR